MTVKPPLPDSRALARGQGKHSSAVTASAALCGALLRARKTPSVIPAYARIPWRSPAGKENTAGRLFSIAKTAFSLVRRGFPARYTRAPPPRLSGGSCRIRFIFPGESAGVCASYSRRITQGNGLPPGAGTPGRLLPPGGSPHPRYSRQDLTSGPPCFTASGNSQPLRAARAQDNVCNAAGSSAGRKKNRNPLDIAADSRYNIYEISRQWRRGQHENYARGGLCRANRFLPRTE